MKSVAFALALMLSSPVWSLPPQIEADRLALKAKAALQEKDYASAVKSFSEMEALGVPLPDTFHYLRGVALNGVAQYGAARGSLENYLNVTGTSGKFYREALEAISLAAKLDPEPEMARLPALGFAMSKYEVTQAQWRKVMGKNPDRLKFPGCDDCPVERVSWNDAQAYLEKLNRLSGKHYRLPKQSEWQSACLGGNASTKFCGGNTIDQVGWYWDMSSPMKTHPVGGKRPNGYGLFDMTGNVAEWTQDCWSGDCRERAVRGGSFCSSWDGALADFKYGEALDYRSECLGLRVAHDLD